MKVKFILPIIACLILMTGCNLKTSESQLIKSTASENNDKAIENMKQAALVRQEETESDLGGVEEEAERLEAYLSRMSIEEKVGQLFIIAIRKDEAGNPITQMNETVRKQIQDKHIGGIILFSENIQTKEQTQRLINDLQEAAKIPLYIGVDEEGGMVSRVGGNSGINEVPFKEAYEIGETKDTAAALEEAGRMGRLLKKLGFNLDFAPVADIYNEPENTVIGRRSFGENEEIVTPMVLAFVKGLQREGIQPVVKHFPGHGNTLQDSHEGTAYVSKGLSELEKEELVPFKEAIEEGAGAVMKGHLLVKAVDDKYIVSLSRKWRDYMESHYDLSDTLIMTDAMDMGAVVQNYGVEESTLLNIEAGNDIILMPYNLDKAYEAILKAYDEGTVTEERINQSVRKILSKKVAQKLLVLA